MVYIHGGGFVRGDSTPTSVGPDYILDHDVVLVSMNYRLGVLGFLSTGDHFASGNFGLKDQALALKWVQQYIEYFGGNPDSVTLFGESAGGVSVNFHVLSTATKGELFSLTFIFILKKVLLIIYRFISSLYCPKWKCIMSLGIHRINNV